ncbi:MAG: nucleoside deaminase [Acutalibacteraceae bacterium]
MSHSEYMNEALRLAAQAAAEGEVPVGAVVVHEGEIIGRGYNHRQQLQNAMSHAEIEALDGACRKLGSWRLEKCSLYVTLEPCPMCAGAIVNARIAEVIFGAYDEKYGCFGSAVNFCDLPFDHRPGLIGGYMQKQCSQILSDFFADNLRKNSETNDSGS